MALSFRDYTFIKVVQATHYHGDNRYGRTRQQEVYSAHVCLLSLVKLNIL